MDRELTITLSEDDVRLIEERVQSGAFPSPAAVIGAALGTLAEAEAERQRQLDELRQSVDELLADPQPSISGDEVLQNIRRRYDEAHLRGRGA